MKLYAAKAPFPFIKGHIRDIRPTWLFKEIGAPFERISLDPMKGETRDEAYKSINPFAKIPAIDDEGFKLYQSSAICIYIADKYQKLIPKAGTQARALHDQWVFHAMTDIESNAFWVFRAKHFLDPKDKDKGEWIEKIVRTALDHHFKVLDQELSTRPYITGENFAVADIILSSVCRVLWDSDIYDSHPNLKKYLEKNYKRPAFIEAWELNGT